MDLNNDDPCECLPTGENTEEEEADDWDDEYDEDYDDEFMK